MSRRPRKRYSLGALRFYFHSLERRVPQPVLSDSPWADPPAPIEGSLQPVHHTITQTPTNAASRPYIARTPSERAPGQYRQRELADLNDRRNTGQRARRDHTFSPTEVMDKLILPALTHTNTRKVGERGIWCRVFYPYSPFRDNPDSVKPSIG